MRIVFMGTPDFAVPSLEILIRHGYDIPAVVTMPDRPGGRLGVLESAVKKCAISHQIPVLQPEKLKNPEFIESLRRLNADLFIVVAFRMLPEIVWNMPPMGTMNLHGSLLPKYRGAAPINWAIIRGEKQTGVTTFLLKHEIDTGDLLYQSSIDIGENETAGALHDRMMLIGADLVLKSVQELEKSSIKPFPQETGAVSHAPKIFTETCQINFNQDTQHVHDFIRGLSPHPGAWTHLDAKVVKILESRMLIREHSEPPGTYVSDGKHELQVATADGFIQVLELQMEGKRKMKTTDFLNGYRIGL